MEVCVGALHLMAREPASRHTIKQLNSIPFFVMVSKVYLSYHNVVITLSYFTEIQNSVSIFHVQVPGILVNHIKPK